ncbi:hypothetical protein RC083_16545 [Pseudoalteromonas haloplanktis]|uniref:Uncharacterized protein n=1 Tax=Pseudoalteromonas haloplanktis TaxID=228 RepID=A0ABU1BFB8_PSEHA|nr:hypothetical protein [Pseudoalteromonas haloplanktis]MDQ9093188.1 hypothetical protein [Pseudoalteromonas haloplanktis]
MSDQQKQASQQQIKLHTNEKLKLLLTKHPELNDKLAQAKGYMLCQTQRLMLVAIGGQNGLCLLHQNNRDAIVDLTSVNVGLGLGSTQGDRLLIFYSQQLIDSVLNGDLSVQLASVSTSGQQSELSKHPDEQIDIININEDGAIASVGVEMVSLKVNKQLTDEQFAQISLPNKSRSQSTVSPWPYKLPFLADDVINKGYKLPKPYGFSVNLVSVEQQMNLTELQVGFNGDEPVPFEFVDFYNPITDLKTTQLKADMWLFPFMNVYAMLGKVEGDINMDVLLDGNMMLQHLDKNCDALITPISCRLLADKQFTLPIRANVSPITYGLGTILAGAWQDWFVTLPFNITWSKPEHSLIDGRSFTFTPRVGKALNLKELGRFSLFIGGNYLDSENRVQGQLRSADGDFILDYKIHQRNTERWNIVTGFNWDISTQLSWNLEYNGYIGSRDAVISGLTLRF